MYARVADGSGHAGGAHTLSKLTGERPQQGVTPDSLLALHDAGYSAVVERLHGRRVLDIGCGEGFESVRLGTEGRRVVGVDYATDALRTASGRHTRAELVTAAADATMLPFGDGCFDAACSSHLVEHFLHPEGHVGELSRVLDPAGTAFVITPNAPADFENPFHLRLFRQKELAALLGEWFDDVEVHGLDAGPTVKEDLDARRARAARILRLDVFDLRHRLPRSWYIAAYTRLLPLAYRLLARRDSGGATGISAEDFFVTAPDAVDDRTLVLFAVCRRPVRRPGN